MADSANFYVAQAGQPIGPLRADELRAHGVQATTLVWQEEMPDWAPAASVHALARLFSPLPPPLPGKVVREEAFPSPPIVPPVLVAPLPLPVPAPVPATAVRPQFSAERSSAHPWWHFVLLAVLVLCCLLGARACGVVLSHLLSTTAAPLPTLPGTLAGLSKALLPGGGVV